MSRAYTWLVNAMAWLAGFLMAGMMLSICVDVIVRNLGFQSSAHLFTFTEYALLMVPCLGAPWLVREKGHVYVEIFLMSVGERFRRVMTFAVGLGCVLVCGLIAWYGFDVTWTNYVRSDVDVRSMDMPRWMVVIFIPIGFLMMGIEFLRLISKGESVLGDLTSTLAAQKPEGRS
ncbi:MAG: TRAP transporter small permease [Betaproteobacteria bacterium]|nr:TRAP transporter small permease [Betaproteobacteria bacterium]